MADNQELVPVSQAGTHALALASMYEASKLKLDVFSEVATTLARFIKEKKLSSRIGDKDYIRVEGWQTVLSGFFGLRYIVDEPVNLAAAGETFTVTLGARDSQKRLISYSAKCTIYAPDGSVVAVGYSICSNEEALRRNYDRYAIYSFVQSRAISRAARNQFGWLAQFAGFEATPADEMETSATLITTATPGAPTAPPEESGISFVSPPVPTAPAHIDLLTGNPVPPEVAAGIETVLQALETAPVAPGPVPTPPMSPPVMPSPPSAIADLEEDDDDEPQGGPAATSTETPGPPQLDAEGFPWDERIHSNAAEKMSAKGVWKRRKNISEEIWNGVRAELRTNYPAPAPAAAAAPAPTPTPAATPAPAPVAATPAPAATPPAAPSAPAVPAPPAAPAAPNAPAAPAATPAPPTAAPAAAKMVLELNSPAFNKMVEVVQTAGQVGFDGVLKRIKTEAAYTMSTEVFDALARKMEELGFQLPPYDTLPLAG